MSRQVIILMAGALLIILIAGALMLDSPEKTTSELVQRLDMRGNWEGSFDDPKDIAKNCLFEYRRSTFFKGSPYIRGTLWTKDQGYVEMGITDEGKGFLKVAREVGTTPGQTHLILG